MNEFNELIKLAIEGGYKVPSPWTVAVVDGELYTFGEKFHEGELEKLCVLDPLFWQSLGKALGWGSRDNKNYMHNIWPQEEWHYHWHKLIDILADGGDINQWARELLKKNV